MRPSPSQRTETLGYKPENIRQDYTGYQKDDESGLEFAQARYYNTLHARFTSIDPLTASANVKDPRTFNRYTYAMNSPYKFTDPLGLISQSTGACGNGCPGGDGGSGFFSEKGAEESVSIPDEQVASDPQPAPAHEALHHAELPPSADTATHAAEAHQGADGIVQPADITTTASMPTTFDATLEETKGTVDLPTGIAGELTQVAQTAEQVYTAQAQNSKAALEAVKREYEYAFANLNPLFTLIFGVLAPDFTIDGRIMTPSPPSIGIDVAVGPASTQQNGVSATYTVSTINLVNAANAQLQEGRQISSSGAASNFAHRMIQTYGDSSGRILVDFLPNRAETSIKKPLTMGTLVKMYNWAVERGRNAAISR